MALTGDHIPDVSPGHTADHNLIDGILGGLSFTYGRRGSVDLFDQDFGLVGDDTTDDTAALNTMVAAAYAEMDAGATVARLIFRSRSYLIAGPLLNPGGAGGAWAQVPLRKRALNASRDNIQFIGATDGPHTIVEEQASVQRAGTIFRSTATGAWDAAKGVPSVIGGPAAYGSVGGAWSNTCPTLKNLTIRLPDNPSVTGADFYWCKQARIENIVQDTNVVLGAITAPTYPTGIGMVLPGIGNNGVSARGTCYFYGSYMGLAFGENTHIQSVVTYKNAISIGPPGNTAGGSRVDNASLNWSKYAIASIDPQDGPIRLPGCYISFGLVCFEDADPAYEPTFATIANIDNSWSGARITGDYSRGLSNTGPQPGLTIIGGTSQIQLRDVLTLGEPDATPWIPLFLANSWANYGGTYPIGAYRKALDGMVELTGLINGGASGASAALLPLEYRPAKNVVQVCAVYPLGSVAFVDIDSSGNIAPLYTGTLSAGVSLDGIRFLPAP